MAEAKVDLSEDAVYRVKDGKLERLDKPPSGFGEVIQKWQDGKLGRYEVTYMK
ncbi:phage protein [Oceanobacillus picturae]|uniref:Phage protein n=1 Tax=Oceanobacillus picturae TaxID=171693 RepID=A0A0U9H9P9_9BACI|nr:DUF3954 domain-containing protein [Oceanobacillus picturae]GAQ18017.1 phage protein [Oceanobacillus picturae]